jgi:two-component system response regulator YesN
LRVFPDDGILDIRVKNRKATVPPQGYAMYRVLISDNMQTELNSLGFLLERDFPGLIELCPASSPSDEIEQSRSLKIDIAVVNASENAPLSSLSHVSLLKQANPSLVLINRPSGPIDGPWMTENFRRAIAAVDIGRRKVHSDTEIREKLGSITSIVESDFIYALVFSSGTSGDLAPYFGFFNITETSYYFMTIDFSAVKTEHRRHAYETLRALAPDFSPCVIGSLMHDRVVAFVPFREGNDPSSDVAKIMSEVRPFHALLSSETGCELKIGVSQIESNLNRSAFAWEESIKAIAGISGSSGVAHYAESADCAEELSASGSYPEEIERKLLERADAGDVSGVHAMFTGLCAWIEKRYRNDLSVLKCKLFELVVLVRHRTRELQPQFGGFAVWKDTLKNLDSIHDSASVERYVLSCLDECVGVIGENKQSRMSPIIVKACAIIHENISDEISLEEIARRVEISPFYFSKLFKEETGENFIDYITMARITRAKELLIDPVLSIKEISGSTGYSDPNYFSKLFKRIVGLTPTEYRESV